MNTFMNMAGTLAKGLTLPFQLIGSATKTAAEAFTSSFFPAPQKTTIVSSNVSNQPYETTQGYRSVVKGATTLGQTFQTWWQNSIIDPIKDTYMGYKKTEVAQSLGQMAADVVTGTAKAVATNLPQYFMEKWGLVKRTDSGERVSNTPVQPANVIYYQDPTQSSAPATVVVGAPQQEEDGFSNIVDFFNSLLNSSQPKGTYSLGYSQQAAIPTPATEVAIVEQKETSSLLSKIGPFLLIGGIALGGWYFLRRR